MILASFQNDLAILGGLLCMSVTAVMLFFGLVVMVLVRIGRSAPQVGASGLAKKVAAKGAVEIAKRLFWKRFG